MTFTYKKAEREAVPMLALFYGYSTSGKTKTALMFAEVFAQGKRIGVIDCDNRRASYYSKEHDFDVIDVNPPFTSQRITEATKVFQDSGVHGCIIVDGISQEWEGLGGVTDQAREIEERTGKRGLHCWNTPKLHHKKMRQNALLSTIPIIYIARGKEPHEQTGSGSGAKIIKKPMMPIQEETFLNEMTFGFELHDRGHVTKAKWSNNELMEILEPLEKNQTLLTAAHAKQLLEWNLGGKKINPRVEIVKQECREAAMIGGTSLNEFFKNLDTADRKLLLDNTGDAFKAECRKIADEADALRKNAPASQNFFDK